MNYTKSYWEDTAQVIGCIPNIEKLYGHSILITGGTGMICSSVADLLFYLNQKQNAGIKIILAGRSRERIRERFHGFREGTDYFYLSYDAAADNAPDMAGLKADYILHGASNANPAIYTKQPVETMLANILGLHHLLDLAARTKAARLLYISSSEVYGNKENNEPYKEEDYGFLDILNQRASYPSAKRAAETLCIAYGEEYGVDTVIVRPGHIYGPTITASDSRASAQFTRNAVQGEDIVLKSAGTQLRSYCYTLDCASAILTVLLNGEKGNAYNISNKASIVTISDLAHAFANAAGRKVIYENPSDLEKKGYNLMTNSSLDAAKLEALGWSACFDIKKGTERTLCILKNGEVTC